MKRLDKLKQDIRSLSQEELSTLRDWLLEYNAERWDRQIEKDALSGKMDKLAEEALKAHTAGMTRLLRIIKTSRIFFPPFYFGTIPTPFTPVFILYTLPEGLAHSSKAVT